MSDPDAFERWAAARSETDAGADTTRGSTVGRDVAETAAGGRGVLDDLRVVARRALQLSRRRWRP